jgi:2',3'-cyclic-nucleotide 2'-phosphodiesterase (5'-nucleotidase family)
MVLGNHEFDFGLDVLLERIHEARFPVLAANVRWKRGGKLLTTPYVLRTLSNGVRVAIFGLVTDETPETTDPINVTDLVFEPPVLAASRFMQALEDSSDILLGVTHVGLRTDKQLADTFDDVDVIVGGHDQVLIHRPLVKDDVIITQAQEYGLYLGRIDLAVDGDDVKILADTVYPITADIPDDPQVARMVASYTERLSKELGRIVGRLAAPLEGDRRVIRKQITNFGLLLTTLMKERTGADLAVVNSGTVRSSIEAGPVTLGDILQALPFANHVVTVQLAGSEIEVVLARSLQLSKRTDSGGFLQTASVSYRATDAGPADIQIEGQPLDRGRLYTVAITDFLFNGGDGYDVFRRTGKNPKDTGVMLAQALADLIAKNSPLTPPEP